MTTIIKKGETFRRVLKLKNVKTGDVLDMTGCTAYSQIRKQPGGTLYASAECAIDTTAGTITALWTADQTADFTIGGAGFDVWLVCGDEQKPVWTEELTIILPYTEIAEDEE